MIKMEITVEGVYISYRGENVDLTLLCSINDFDLYGYK